MKTQPFALLKFIYKGYGKYGIQIVASSDDLLKKTYQLEKVEIETEIKDINKAFNINETIKVIIEKNINNDNFKAKTIDYLKIFNSKYGHFVRVSIEGRNHNKFLLSVALAVYNQYKKDLYPLFIAKKTIYDIDFFKSLNPIHTINNANNINSIKNNNINNINSKTILPYNNYNTIEKYKGKFSLQSQTLNKRSSSTIKSSFNFGIKDKEFFQELEFDYMNLNETNINALSKVISSKIFGLYNLGNTCFLNSSLQIIIHSPLFIQNFLRDIYYLRPRKNTLAYSFFNLIMDIYSSNREVFSPKDLISKFLEKCHLFYLGEQSDSQRFYRNFMTILDKELGISNTCIKQTFEGKFRYNNQFNCQNKLCKISSSNIVEQNFYDVFLSVPERDCSIKQLIDQTYRTQSIKSNQKCRCKNNFILTRNIIIIPNKYFGINFQRGKISNRTLKSTDIAIQDFNDSDGRIYEPYAMNFHYGTMDYGHYYSYIKIDNDNSNIKNYKWYYFNDQNFNTVECPKSSREIINIFYRLKDI